MLRKFIKDEFRNSKWFIVCEDETSCTALHAHNGLETLDYHRFTIPLRIAFDRWNEVKPTEDEVLEVMKWLTRERRK